MSKNKVIIIGLVAAALVATIVVSKQQPAETQTTTENQNTFVEATKISADFKDNKATALETYKDKTIEINGIVKQLDKTPGVEHIVFVSSVDSFEVKAKFSNKAEVEKLVAINAGQNVVVKCTGETTESTFAEFKDCSVVNSGSSQPVEATKNETAPVVDSNATTDQNQQPASDQKNAETNAPAEATPASENAPATAPANNNPAANN